MIENEPIFDTPSNKSVKKLSIDSSDRKKLQIDNLKTKLTKSIQDKKLTNTNFITLNNSNTLKFNLSNETDSSVPKGANNLVKSNNRTDIKQQKSEEPKMTPKIGLVSNDYDDSSNDEHSENDKV